MKEQTGDATGSVLDALASLVDKSLLRRTEQPIGDIRFSMLETIREYALERLVASGEAMEAHRWHAAYFLRLAQETEADRIGLGSAPGPDRLSAERDNLRAALRWLRERDDVEQALHLAAALWPLWLEHGDLTEGRAQLTALLALPSAPAYRVAWAKTLAVAGALAQAQGDHDQAVALSQQALAACRLLGDQRGTAAALTTLGLDALVRGDYEQATAHLEESLILFRTVGDARAGSWSLRHLGSVAYRRGDLPRAAALAAEGLALVRAAESPLDIARLLHNLGVAVAAQGDQTCAVSAWEESLALFRAVGDPWGVADTLCSLGSVAYERGEQDRAAALMAESLALFRDVGDPSGTAFVLGRVGWLARSRGDPLGAARQFEESLAIARAGANHQHMAEALLGLAVVSLDRHDLTRAAEYLGQRLRLVVALSERAAMAGSLEWTAHLAAAAGHDAGGAQLLGAAGRLRETIGVPRRPPDRIEHQRLATSLKTKLGDTAFAAAVAAGAALSLDDALATAAGLSGDPVNTPVPVAAGGLRLTLRERQVLALLVEGRPDREIADMLFISSRTASNHVANILAKLEVKSRTAAVGRSIREGLA